MRQYGQLSEIFNITGDERSKVMLNDVFFQNLVLLGVVFAVLSLATIALTVWLTHRIYGPQIAITKFVREVARGNFHVKLRLRAGDEFHDLADDLNQMVSTLDRGNVTSMAQVRSKKAV